MNKINILNVIKRILNAKIKVYIIVIILSMFIIFGGYKYTNNKSVDRIKSNAESIYRNNERIECELKQLQSTIELYKSTINQCQILLESSQRTIESSQSRVGTIEESINQLGITIDIYDKLVRELSGELKQLQESIGE